MGQTETPPMAEEKLQDENVVLNHIEVESIINTPITPKMEQVINMEILTILADFLDFILPFLDLKARLELALSFITSLNKSYSISRARKWWTRFLTWTPRIIFKLAMLLTRSWENYYPHMLLWPLSSRSYNVRPVTPPRWNASVRKLKSSWKRWY